MKSEFPETRLTKIGRKIGWLLSPLLFISLLIFTFLSAQSLKFDIISGRIEETAYIHLKEVTDSDVYFDDVKVGRTSQILSTVKDNDSTKPLRVKILSSDDRKWEKSVSFQDGLASIYYPILYPKNIEFDDDSFEASDIYPTDTNGIFFYERIEDNKIKLYRYSASRLLFGLNVRNDLFADLTSYLSKSQSIETPNIAQFKSKEIIPGHTGKNVAVIIPNEKAFILSENGRVLDIPNYVPKSSNKYFWSPNEDYFVIQNDREILSKDITNNRVNLIYRSNSIEETPDIQFCIENSIIYKVTTPESISLFANTYPGNNPSQIDLPNLDNIRRNNLIRAYDMIKKQSMIIIQSENNIYSFNLTNYQLKKFNLFEGEKVIYTDSENQVILTNNSKSKNQFRYYDLARNTDQTFTFSDIDINESPEKVIGFNFAQNIFLKYKNSLKLSDIDGANQVNINYENRDTNIITAIKENRSVLLAKSEQNSDASYNKYSVSIARFQN